MFLVEVTTLVIVCLHRTEGGPVVAEVEVVGQSETHNIHLSSEEKVST